jgi:subtilase family serine protease
MQLTRCDHAARTLAVVALCALGACGRTAQISDGGVELPKPCRPTCDQVCTLISGCIASPVACVSNCWDIADPTMLCIGQHICNDTATCDSVLRCMTHPTVPDLTIDFYPYASGPGRIELQAKVCNIGSGSAPSASVHFYRDHSTSPSPGERGDVITVVAGLAPGDCRTVTASDVVSAGTYRTWAQVDVEGSVLESDEGNNVAGPVVIVVTGANLPDLVVTSLQAQTQASGAVSYGAQVCNQGTAAAAPSIVDLYYDRAGAPSSNTPGDLSSTVGPLAAGACVSVNFFSVALQLGSYRSWAFVDRRGQVQESNEANNITGPVVVTVGGAQKPDLKVTATATLAPSGYVTYAATVCNGGFGVAGPTTLELYLDRSSAPTTSAHGDQTVTVGSLTSGACQVLTLVATLSPGSYSSWLMVDRLNSVVESNEGNNTYGPIAVVVPGGVIDLTVTKLSYSIAPTGVGPVTYYATICNPGKSSVPSTQLGLYYNRATAPVAGTAADLVVPVAAIKAGTCLVQSTTVTLSPGGYQSWAWVDPANAVPEANEANNVAGPLTVVVGKTQADLVINSFSHYVSPTGSLVYYYVTVCNAGLSYTSDTSLEVYYDSASEPTASAVGDQSSTIQQLGPGGCTSRTFTATLAPGQHTSWAVVDRKSLVPEFNESNNAKGPLTVSVPGGTLAPDLVISNFTASPPTSAGVVIYDLQVCNKGQGPAVASGVDIYYNRATAPTAGTKGDALAYVPALAVGACSSTKVQASLSPGTYTSWAYVDASNSILETNESNNVGGPQVFSVSAALSSDLVVDSLSVQVSGSSATYAIKVCNLGLGSSGSCYIGVYYNSATAPTPPTPKPDGSVYIGPIGPGACFTASWIATLADGSYTSWAYVDSTMMVKETDETNNVSKPLGVGVGLKGTCESVCTMLVSPCLLLLPTQLGTCVATCVGQPQTKIDCAVKAAASQLCYDIISCLFS